MDNGFRESDKRREDLQEQDNIQPGDDIHSVTIANNLHSAEICCLSLKLLGISMIVGTNDGHDVRNQMTNQNVCVYEAAWRKKENQWARNK